MTARGHRHNPGLPALTRSPPPCRGEQSNTYLREGAAPQWPERLMPLPSGEIEMGIINILDSFYSQVTEITKAEPEPAPDLGVFSIYRRPFVRDKSDIKQIADLRANGWPGSAATRSTRPGRTR